MVEGSSSSRPQKFSDNDGYHEFFKVYLPDHSSRHLKIPPAFVKHFRGALPWACVLEGPTNKARSVNLKKVYGNVILEDGWEEFVEDNCLEFGDFLTFSYDGSSKFYVRVFGNNGCKKEVAAEKVQHRGDQMAETSTQPEQFSHEKRTAKQIIQRGRGRPSSAFLLNGCSYVEIAKKFKSNFPHFKVAMGKTYLTSGYLSIPTTFIREHMEWDQAYLKDYDVTVRISNRTWTVKLRSFRQRWNYKLTTGWTEFSMANSLQEGDVCVFELIDRESLVFEVSIIRTVKLKELSAQRASSGSPSSGIVHNGGSSIEVAKKFKSSYPHFKIAMGKFHVIRGHLYLPWTFGGKYMRRGHKYLRDYDVTLQISDKTWTVHFRSHIMMQKCRFTTGWIGFVRANRLREGDVCVFELINCVALVFEVSIIRARSTLSLPS